MMFCLIHNLQLQSTVYSLQSTVYQIFIQYALHVEYHAFFPAERTDYIKCKFLMRYRKNNGIILNTVWNFLSGIYSVFMLNFLRISPRIINVYINIIIL